MPAVPEIMYTRSETPQEQVEPKALLQAIKKCFTYYQKRVRAITPEVWKGHKAKVKNISKYRETLKECTAYDTKTIVVIIRYPEYDSNVLLEGADWQVQYCDDIYRREGMDFNYNGLLQWFDHVYSKDIAPAMNDAFGFLQNYAPTAKMLVERLNSMSPEDRHKVTRMMEYGEHYGEKRNWQEIIQKVEYGHLIMARENKNVRIVIFI